MNTTTEKPLDVVSLIQCLAGELLADPSIVFETIKEDEDLQRIIRSYRLGDFTYYEVLDSFNDYF
jgi:hypothetical protein